MYYMYFIFNELYEHEPMEDWSYLYTSREECEREALQRVKELEAINETENAFVYEIIETKIAR